jgi:hypothetical protein
MGSVLGRKCTSYELAELKPQKNCLFIEQRKWHADFLF